MWAALLSGWADECAVQRRGVCGSVCVCVCVCSSLWMGDAESILRVVASWGQLRRKPRFSSMHLDAFDVWQGQIMTSSRSAA